MSFSVNAINAESTSVTSLQAVSEQQLLVDQVKAGKIQADENKTETSTAVRSNFGMTGDTIEISEQGRKALEQIYAAKTEKASAPETFEGAEKSDNIELESPHIQAQKPTEDDSLRPRELQNMSVSDLRQAVTKGGITHAQMDDELSRRESVEMQKEQKVEEIRAVNEKINAFQDINKAVDNMNNFNVVKQYAAMSQSLAH